MKFPDSYYKYKDVNIQWVHVWGKFETGVFFHCAFFDVLLDGKKRTSIHTSLHTPEPQYYETANGRYTWNLVQASFYTNTIRLNAEFSADYFKREGPNRIYRWNPNIKIVGKYFINGEWTDKLEAEGWVEEEHSSKNWAGIIYEKDGKPKVNNWTWVGIKLNDSRSIVVYNQENDHYCAIVDGNQVQEIKEYELINNELYLNDINMKVTLQPIAITKRFNPMLGMAYSEQPMKVVIDGMQAGFAMREVTNG